MSGAENIVMNDGVLIEAMFSKRSTVIGTGGESVKMRRRQNATSCWHPKEMTKIAEENGRRKRYGGTRKKMQQGVSEMLQRK